MLPSHEIVNWFQDSIIQQHRQTSKAERSSLTVEGLHLVFTWYKWGLIWYNSRFRNMFLLHEFVFFLLLPFSRDQGRHRFLEETFQLILHPRTCTVFTLEGFSDAWFREHGWKSSPVSCLLFILTGVYQPQAQSVSALMSCQWVVLTRFTAFKKGRAGSTLYCLEKQMPNCFLSIFLRLTAQEKILMKSHFTTLDKHTININIFNLLDKQKKKLSFFLCQ